MLKKSLFSLLLIGFVFSYSNAQLKGVFDKVKKEVETTAEKIKTGGAAELSQEEVGNGLKEALNIGVSEAVDFLSAENGYHESIYKILIPEDAQKVVSKLKKVPGFYDIEDKLVEKMNRAAELAAEKAKPIFVNAITSMTFEDAWNILRGDKDAATRYLQSTTGQQLFAEFMPVIQASLDEVNAREYWRKATTAYNKLPFVQKTNPELDQHVTNKALDGMFGLVEVKELEIRENVSARTSDLLKRVFGEQD